MILGLLGACGAPISNAPFLEEQTFLRALPLPERVQAPSEIRLAPAGNSTVLAEAKAFAQAHDDQLRILLEAGALLTEEEGPSQRTSTRRVWEPFPFTFDDGGTSSGGEPVDGWMQVSVERPAGGQDLEWTLELGQGADDPWIEVGHGDYDGENEGTIEWDLDAAVAALALTAEPRGAVTMIFEDLGNEVPELQGRDVTATFSRTTLVPVRMLADTILQFSSNFEVTADDASFPGIAVVSHVEWEGGWAVGAVFAGQESEIAFETCWDVDGNALYMGGDDGIRVEGDVGSCPSPPPDDLR
ncbi:MAG: hypothetical protein KTR31_27435 [Myxococcales bacterium]|nr:hypothetical protein [Myxococcales bacterium]